MNLRLIAAFVAANLVTHAAEPPPPADFVVGKKLTLHSSVLNEDRPLQIFTPSNYESAKSSYPTLPVLYLLDGPDHFIHVTGLVDYLARHDRIPPMIIVAVGNTDRTRDLTPTHTLLSVNGKEEDSFGTSGGAAKFFDFLRGELMPFVEKTYRTAPFRILDGHSFGGLFALKVLLENPDTFQAYIAVSPSLWWDHQVMLKNAGPIGRGRQYLYLSVGNEGGIHRRSIEQFAAQLKERAAPTLTWDFKPYEDEAHNSVPHQTLYDGLKLIYADWHLPDLAIEAEPITFAEAAKHYRTLSEKYGYEIPLPLTEIQNVAYGQAFHEQWSAAIASYREAIRLYPKSAIAYSGLAGIYEKKGDKAEAIVAYQKALEINPKNTTAKKALEKLVPAAKAP